LQECRKQAEKEIEELNRKRKEENERKEAVINAIKSVRITKNDVMKTTGFDFVGYKIVRYCGIVTDTALYSLGMMTDLKNAMNFKAMVAGKEYSAFSEKVQTFIDELMNDMALEALYKGANGLVGISYSCAPYWNTGDISLMITMSGTAVCIEKE
jgi:uncharacterized protein YbjQ (UPF0145 family)